MNSLVETLVITVIVGIAAWYLIRRFLSNISPKAENACGCGCSGCSIASECDEAGGILECPPEQKKV